MPEPSPVRPAAPDTSNPLAKLAPRSMEPATSLHRVLSGLISRDSGVHALDRCYGLIAVATMATVLKAGAPLFVGEGVATNQTPPSYVIEHFLRGTIFKLLQHRDPAGAATLRTFMLENPIFRAVAAPFERPTDASAMSRKAPFQLDREAPGLWEALCTHVPSIGHAPLCSDLIERVGTLKVRQNPYWKPLITGYQMVGFRPDAPDSVYFFGSLFTGGLAQMLARQTTAIVEKRMGVLARPGTQTTEANAQSAMSALVHGPLIFERQMVGSVVDGFRFLRGAVAEMERFQEALGKSAEECSYFRAMQFLHWSQFPERTLERIAINRVILQHLSTIAIVNCSRDGTIDDLYFRFRCSIPELFDDRPLSAAQLPIAAPSATNLLAVLLIAGLPVDERVQWDPETFIDALAGLRDIERWLDRLAKEPSGPFAARATAILAELAEIDIRETYRELVPETAKPSRLLMQRALLLGLNLR